MPSSRKAVEMQRSVERYESFGSKGVSPNSAFLCSVKVRNAVTLGGAFCWVVNLFLFSVNFLLSGFLKSFSTIFTDIIDTMLSHVSWFPRQIGHLSLVCSPVTGMLISRRGYRPLVYAAGVLCCVGWCLSFFQNCDEILIGRISTILGVGVTFAFTQAVVFLGPTTERPAARSIALSGGFLAAIVKPSVINAFFEVLGTRYTFLVFFAAICLCGLLLGPSRVELLPVAKECCKEARRSDKCVLATANSFILKRVLPLRFLADHTFILTVASIFVMGIGYQYFLHYVPQQAEALGAEPGSAMMLLSYSAVGDLVARLLYGALARRCNFTRSAEHAAALLISATAVLLTIFCTTYGYLIGAAILAGLGTGLWIVQIPLLLEANHGVGNVESTFTLLGYMQCIVNFSYSPLAAMLNSMFGTEVVQLIVGALTSFSAVLGFLFHIVAQVRGRKMC